ncbi:hypothetical protein K503DRAFT_276674 [Rhizopogon vinicolor AM-OR11-026]|uniref:MACPF domain-containing protein n=1 Tax=Rhizopogon vinicolor AM-OR11-026 TaxID=1314800 RepID=A0A1B7MW21_9AGAM|nr:hypothetical protein K503DRAFT_276674 [Rhizopogon vinicolor AM-OR11-026]
MSNELPAISWLGYSLNMSAMTTMDINAVTRAVLKARRLVDYDTKTNLHQVTIDGKVYDVPAAITIIDDAPSNQGEYIHYASGADARAAFRTDVSLAMRYFAVYGAMTVTASSERALTKENQYAFYSFTKTVYSARLTNYANLLNKHALQKGVAELTRPFIGTNSDILEEYKSFFQRYGSHVIVAGNYGARFQLNTWASNKTETVNNKFSADILTAFDGIPSGGQFDAGLTKEAQYDTFLEYMQRLISVSGGGATLAQAVSTNPSSLPTYKLWLDSVPKTPLSNVLSFQAMEIWALMALSEDTLLIDSAKSLDAAFAYILANPSPYKTAVAFDIYSDWAEFNLLTPSAVIEHDPNNLFPSNTVSSSTRVQWGKHGHPSERQTLRFFVLNDGSPIDFSISHGSNGSGGAGTRRAEAIIEESSYLNDGITDNVWNTRWFYRAPVSDVPERENAKLSNDDPCTS